MNQLPGQRPRWIPTQQTVRQMLAPSLVFIVACLDRQFQTDFWMHLARGAEIIATGRFITADHFTIAGAAASVLDANWLSQVFYFRLFSWGGLPLVQMCNALTLAAALWFLVRLCHRNGTSWRSAAAGGVIAFLVAWQTFLIRPQSFSVLLFVLLYAILRGGMKAVKLRTTPSLRYSQGLDQTLVSEPSEYLRLGVVSVLVPTPSRAFTLLVCPPLILLLWANLHGGFVIGLVLIGVFTLAAVVDWIRHCINAAVVRSLVASLLLSILATLVNPYGWRIYQYAFSLTARVMPRHIEEWMPPPMNQWMGKALVASALLVAGLHFFRRRWPTARDALLMLCFLPLAFHAARMVIWWAIVVAPMIASLLDSMEPEPEPQSSPIRFWMSGLVCAVLVSVCVLSLPWLERINPIYWTIRSSHRTESDLNAIAEAGLFPSRAGKGIILRGWNGDNTSIGGLVRSAGSSSTPTWSSYPMRHGMITVR